MDVDVISEIVIHRPVAVVAAFASDPTNAPKWYENISTVEWKSEPPVTVGSTVEFVAQFLGRRLCYTYRFDEVIPDERIVMRTEQGPFPMETTYEWRPTGEGDTRMTLRNRGRPSGFSALMAPLMRPAIRRANRKDLSRLQQLLEAS